MILLVYTCVKFCNSYSHDRVHRGFSIKLNSEVKLPLRITECQADKIPERFSLSFFFFFVIEFFYSASIFTFFKTEPKKIQFKIDIQLITA